MSKFKHPLSATIARLRHVTASRGQSLSVRHPRIGSHLFQSKNDSLSSAKIGIAKGNKMIADYTNANFHKLVNELIKNKPLKFDGKIISVENE